VIIPLQAEAFTEVVQRARSRGIRVISYDRLARNAGADLYISVNSEKVGRLMASTVIRAAPAGNYAFIYGPESDWNVSLLREGVRSVLADYPGVFNILEAQASNWSYDEAYLRMAELLEMGKIPSAVICGNDGLAGGVIRALAEYRLAGKVHVVGQDADLTACQRVAQGTQLATVYKPITELAREAARQAVAMAYGGWIPPAQRIYDGVHQVPVLWLEPSIVTKENLREVVLDSGFHTPEDLYRTP
jgi:D-xylose transport system substrate-binding protein